MIIDTPVISMIIQLFYKYLNSIHRNRALPSVNSLSFYLDIIYMYHLLFWFNSQKTIEWHTVAPTP